MSAWSACPRGNCSKSQDQDYRDSVLPPAITARVTVEEASTIGWDRYAGSRGVILGMHSFGMSAPIKIVADHFGFTTDHVVGAARQALGLPPLKI